MDSKTNGDSEAQKTMILQDNMWRVMFRLSWPAVVAMVLYGLNTMLDAVFVGYYCGQTALAGVSLAYPLTQLSIAFGSLIGVGGGALLSIAIGKNDMDTQKKLLGNVNFLSLVSAVLFIAAVFPFSRALISVMGGSGEALDIGTDYFSVTIIGALFWIHGLAGNMIVRAEGKMKTAALLMALGLLVNAAFNYLFIALMGLGAVGAAWGTNIGMLVYTLSGLLYFASGKASFKTRAFSLRIDGAIIASILKLGASSLIMSVMYIFQGWLVFNALAKYGDTADIAFYGAVFRILNLLMTPIYGLMRALQPVAGINYGAGRYERTIGSYKVFAAAAAGLTFPFWALVLTAPRFVLGMMLPGSAFPDQQVLMFRLFISILPLLALVMNAMTFFPSVGKGGPAAFIGMARQLVFYVPVMLIAPRFFGVPGIYYGALAIDLVVTAMTLVLIGREFASLRKRERERCGEEALSA